MDKAEWAKVKKQLRRPWPYGRARLLADGYEVTLELQMTQNMFQNAIAVYVNGSFRGKWLMEDCEERRRFLPQREKALMSREVRARWNKLSKQQQKRMLEAGVDPNRTYTVYGTHWTSWSALVKHFEAHNADIRLLEDTEC